MLLIKRRLPDYVYLAAAVPAARWPPRARRRCRRGRPAARLQGARAPTDRLRACRRRPRQPRHRRSSLKRKPSPAHPEEGFFHMAKAGSASIAAFGDGSVAGAISSGGVLGSMASQVLATWKL